MEFSPFEGQRLAVATAQYFGIVGNGRLHVIDRTIGHDLREVIYYVSSLRYYSRVHKNLSKYGGMSTSTFFRCLLQGFGICDVVLVLQGWSVSICARATFRRESVRFSIPPKVMTGPCGA